LSRVIKKILRKTRARIARLTPSVSFADRPSAFRLPASRTAGGKLYALKEEALWAGYLLSKQ